MSLIVAGIMATAQAINQHYTNRQNKEQASAANSVSESMQAEGQAWSKEMSNSAHQRQVKDLEAAGLNPLLSSTGGASAPGGSGGQGTQARMENEMNSAMSTALEVEALDLVKKKNTQEIKNMKTNEKKQLMETKVMSKGIPKADLMNKVYKKMMDFPAMYLKDQQKHQSNPNPWLRQHRKP